MTNGLTSDSIGILSFPRDIMILHRAIIRNQEVVRSMGIQNSEKKVRDVDEEGENDTHQFDEKKLDFRFYTMGN